MLSLKSGNLKTGSAPNALIVAFKNRLTSIIDSKTQASYNDENSIVVSAAVDGFEHDFTMDEIKMLQTYLSNLVVVNADNIDTQTKKYEDHSIAYCRELKCDSLPQQEEDYMKLIDKMTRKGLQLEYNKLELCMIGIRLRFYTSESANRQLKTDRLMSRTVNKMVSLLDEDGFNRVNYVKDMREKESKASEEKIASALKKREELDDGKEEATMESTIAEVGNDDKTQRRKLKAKSTVPKESFVEGFFRNVLGR